MPRRLAPLHQDALEVVGVVGGEDDGVAGQVLVPGARQPEAERLRAGISRTSAVSSGRCDS
jgi:hypothetical protein